MSGGNIVLIANWRWCRGLLSGGMLDLLSVLHKAALRVPARRLSAGDLESLRVVLNLEADALSVAAERKPSARIWRPYFNTASVLFQLLAEPGGKSRLVHLVNYADYRQHRSGRHAAAGLSVAIRPASRVLRCRPNLRA